MGIQFLFRKFQFTTGNRPLPMAKSRARGKELFCRVPHSAKKALPSVRHSAKPDTRQRPFLPSVRPSANPGARQKAASGNGRRLPSRFAECQRVGTRQTTSLPSARPWHSAKNNGKLYFSPLLNSKIFVESSYSTWDSMLKFGTFLWLFAIFS